MLNHRIVISNLDEALTLVKELLSETQVSDIRLYINTGEWGLALEILCNVLYENEIPIPLRAYELLREVGTTLKLKSQNWEVLRPQVVD